jgi:hypothetical protein
MLCDRHGRESGANGYVFTFSGEMHYVPSGVDSWFNLPRDKGVAYAAQESWVMNETIKVCRIIFVVEAYSQQRRFV